MTSLTKTELFHCATRTGAFGVRVIQPNEISDFLDRTAGVRDEFQMCLTDAKGPVCRGLEQGKQ